MRRVVSILPLLALAAGVVAAGIAPPATADAASRRPQTYLALAERTLAWNGIVADGFAAFAAASAGSGGDACATPIGQRRGAGKP